MPPVRVGLIGYGFSVKCFHLPFINAHPDYRVAAFFQRAEAPKDPKSAQPGSHCTVDYPDAKHHRTADEFFGDKDIDVVIVCSKTDTHAPYAEKALLAGKHGMSMSMIHRTESERDADGSLIGCLNRETAVVEKPFTRTAEEADRIISLAKEKGLILTCFQNRRWVSCKECPASRCLRRRRKRKEIPKHLSLT